MQAPTNPWKMADLVPKEGSVFIPGFTPEKTRPVTIFTSNDFTYEIGRSTNGRVTALFHRNLKTGEAKL